MVWPLVTTGLDPLFCFPTSLLIQPHQPCFFVPDVLGSFPLPALCICCSFTCTSLINHYSPFRPPLKGHFWCNHPITPKTSFCFLSTCFPSFSFSAVIFQINPLFERQQEMDLATHCCLPKARNDRRTHCRYPVNLCWKEVKIK